MLRTVAAIAALALIAAPASAQEAKKVKLRWYGQSFFQLETGAGTKIVFDPHAIPEYGRHLVGADLILVSHPHTDHFQPEVIENHQKAKTILGWKGKGSRPAWNLTEEKFKDALVRTVGTYHDRSEGMERGRNTVFVVEVDGLKIVHLGDLGHELTPEQVKSIGPVDVLMVPVGGVYTLNGSDAKTVVKQLKPRLFVVPMHYGTKVYEDLLPIDEFLKDQTKVDRRTDTNELVVSADMKADAPTTVVLGWTKK
jgi:L-ascorbate metabolism protein UlaG (beta-lactamase superfamily)